MADQVYVGPPTWPYGRMMMCHLMADKLEDLHAMADKLGLKRDWFQWWRFPHYDICKKTRARAIKLGAVEVSDRELVKIRRRYRRRPYV